MKKMLVIVICLLGTIGLFFGVFGSHSEEPEKIIFYTLDEEIDGTAADILESARID